MSILTPTVRHIAPKHSGTLQIVKAHLGVFSQLEVKKVDRLYRVWEVAEILGLRPASVRKLLSQGKLRRVYPTGLRAVRIRASEVEQILREGTLRPVCQRSPHAGEQRLEVSDGHEPKGC